MDEFIRYCSLQPDQAPLASLLVYLKRKGGWVQLNLIWRELGPTGGGPFWNQTTLMNKLDKLERLEIVNMERRLLPSSRDEAKKKTNTFYRLGPATPIYPYIYGMLKIYKGEADHYSSELVDKPLDRLIALAGKQAATGDRAAGRELEVAMEMIGEVFSVGGDEVKRMIKERMGRKGVIKDVKKDKKKDEGGVKKTPKKRARKGEKMEAKSEEQVE